MKAASSLKYRSLALWVVALALVLGVLGRNALPDFFATARAQDAAQAAADKAHDFKFKGVQRCADCHYRPTPLREEAGVTRFIPLTESETWLKQDKHALAFKRIDPEQSPLARQMVEALKIPDIHQAKECLSCHANWQYDPQAKEWAARPIDYKLGVTCESCHGPSSAWDEPHSVAEFRAWTPEKKAEIGMVEVRNPAARAKQCLACHVGDPSQGKVVTHEMYAAGHPPLPGVELETFAAEMPPHWRHITDKLAGNARAFGEEKAKFDFYDEFVAANPSATAGGPWHQARGALVSAVVSMQMALALVGHETEQTKQLPDFAAFDCYACHHDLKTPAWRQRRTEGNVPGRPRPAVWPLVLVETAIVYAHDEASEPLERWRAKVDAWQQAFDARPFGDPQRLTDARAALTTELGELLAATEKQEATDERVLRALRHLLSPRADQTIDHDAARQIAWGAKILFGTLERKPAADKVEPIFERWQKEFHLALPSQQSREIVDDLPARLKTLAAFDPAAFRASLSELTELLGE